MAMMRSPHWLALCTVVVATTGCQNNVVLQNPTTPPPPPPPSGIDATVSILGLDLVPGPGSVNPTAVAGDINVTLNVEEGDNTVTGVDLLFDGTPVGCTTINTNAVPIQGMSASMVGSGSTSAVIECFWDTDDFAGTCEGNNLSPAFGNGTHTLGARITLEDGTTRTASNTQAVTLVNNDLLTLVMLAGGQSVVSGGVRYYGGPRDLDGDGTDDNPVDLAVCPVSFSGTTVASLGLSGATGSTTDVDLGSGSGAAHLDSSEPFLWTVDPGDNDRVSGNLVEDDVTTNGITGGHDFMTAGTILDAAGLNVTAQFAGATLADIFLDFVSPLPGAGSELTVDGVSTAGGGYYSPGSTFGASGVTDAGVGFTFGSGTGTRVDIGDCTVAANFDNDPSTTFTALFADVTSPADADEDDWSVGDDGGPFPRGPDSGIDCYVAEVVQLQDQLGNVTDLVAIGAPDGAVNTGAGGVAVAWGVDATPPTVVVLEPDTDPADSPVLVLNPDPNDNGGADPDDFTLGFELTEPILASGDPGSQVAKVACDPCTTPAATDQGSTNWPVLQLTGNLFHIDIAGQVDGPYTMTIDFMDRALPGNSAADDFTYVLDNSAPAISALDPAPVGSPGTAANAIVMAIGETIRDANLIAVADLTVTVNGTDATGTGASISCAAAAAVSNLYTLSVAGGDIDRNALDLSNGTNVVDFSGSTSTPEAFTISDPFGSGAGGTVEYCFLIDAEDEAVDKMGVAAPNVSQLVTSVSVAWLP